MLKKQREVPNSWVMLSDTEGFVRLPGERVLYTSPPRTTLSLQTPSTYPGVQPLSISSGAGSAHLTNQRIVYLPASPTPTLRSFSAPILNLHDTHVSAPFFGPNVWTAALQPVTGGGIPPTQSIIELKMVFKEGGAFDFHQHFERVKERLLQAMDVARESGNGEASAGANLAGVNLAAVHLEQLPAYEETNLSSMSPLDGFSPHPWNPARHDSGAASSSDGQGSRTSPFPGERPVEERFEPPIGPPPGYEEAQAQSVGDEFERRLRRSR
ncbi:hypothetical protein FGG08_005944 [Glutinoglossum americanum]|uniref:WW-domain-binding protein n=1 Tax=Glutinoglossum americanum TaxID=1670608 RepID=A0A9P8HZB8_9PEZI|nr:hypothetical protein FGG08_005944 [Glutinoglossum americanum]